MDATNPATAPGDRPREARAAARERLAGATGNGSDAYVFRREAGDASERALYASRVEDAVARGRAAFGADDFVEGTEAARRAVAGRRSARG